MKAPTKAELTANLEATKAELEKAKDTIALMKDRLLESRAECIMLERDLKLRAEQSERILLAKAGADLRQSSGKAAS